MERAMDVANPVQAQEVGEFAVLVREHQSMVFSLAYHLLRDRALAEDIAQEVFLELHRRLSKMESAQHVTHWLRRVTTTKSIDAIRKRKVRPEVALDDADEPADTTKESDPMAQERLRRLVASLPEQQRAVVVLRYQEELEPEEIAAILKIPVNTIKSQLQRALALLREKIGVER